MIEPLEERRVLSVDYVANSFIDVSQANIVTSTPTVGDTVDWQGGGQFAAVNGLTFGTNAFTSIQAAVNAAGAGATVDVAPGTYSEEVTIGVNNLTLNGAQFGVAATNAARGTNESILDALGNSGETQFVVGGNDDVIDGFTIQNETATNHFGAAIYIQPGHHGTHVVNDIVQNNQIGLFLVNDSSTDQAVVQNDLFKSNNQTGPASGTGIYLDQYTANQGVANNGGVQNVLIDSNTFLNNNTAGIGFSSTDGTNQTSNITVSNNLFNGNGNGLYMYETTGSTITHNTIENSTRSGLDILGGDSGDTISNNTITNNNTGNNSGRAGIHIGSYNSTGPNSNITITNNGIYSQAHGNNLQLDAYPATAGTTANPYSGILNASFNYWGSTSDTANYATIGDLSPRQVDFSPFLDNGNQGNPNTPGFTPDDAHVTVTTLGAQPATPGPIEAAILGAAPNAIVTINAGTYTEDDIVITQGITLLANGAVTIQAPATAPNPGITVNAAGASVTLQGFTLTGFTTGISATAANTLNLTDVTLTGNTSGGSVFGVTTLDVSGVVVASNEDVTLAGGASSSTIQFAGQDAITYSGLTNLSIATGSGSNQLTVDFTSGNPIPSGGLTYNGGSGASSTMLLEGGSFASEVYAATGPHSGTVTLDSSKITYSGLAPIQDTNTATTLTVNGTAAAEQINVVDGPVVNGFQTTEVNSGTSGTFELVDFANKTVAVVNGNGGADTVAVNNPAPAAGLTSLALTVNGAGSTVTLDTASVPTSVNNLAASATSATVNVGDSGSLSGITNNVTVSGATGSTALLVDDSADTVGQTATITASQISGLAPVGAQIKYTAPQLSELEVKGGSGANTFDVTSSPAGATTTIDAGNAGDLFNITGSGLGGTNNFNGGSGSDTFNVTGLLAAPANINGGSPANDTLNFNAATHAVTVSASTITQAGASTLTYSGIETLNITNDGGVTLQGTANATNKVNVQRDLTNAGLDDVTLNGGPTITVSTASSLDYVGGGGSASNQMTLTEDANGLPLFLGAAAGSHTNTAFTGSGLSPSNIGVNFQGAGSGANALVLDSSNPHNAAYFDDHVGTRNSGVVNVAAGYTLSFTGLSPITFNGAGGTLTVSDAADATTSQLTVSDVGAGVSQVTGNGGFEATTFSGYDNLVVQGNNANNNAITLASVDAGTVNGHALGAVTLQGGTGGDTLTVNSLPGSITATLLGGDGTNQFTLDNATHNLQSIAGPVIVSPAGDSATANDTLSVNDSGDTAGRTVLVTATTLDGITAASSPAISYDASGRIRTVNITGGNHGNTVNIQSTNASATGGYHIATGAGNDTVNVSSDAPTDTGVLAGITANISLDTGLGVDTMNVSDLGGSPGTTYTLSGPGASIAPSTLTASTMPGTITFGGPSGGVGQLENFNLTGGKAGGNTYDIGLTPATVHNTITDGNASGTGGSTFNIQADKLQAGATNTFNGNEQDNTFNLNYAANASTSTVAGTTLVINAGTTGTSAARNVVNVNATADTLPRALKLTYPSATGGDLNVASGLGTDPAGPGVQITAAQEFNFFGGASDSDTAAVTGPGSASQLSVTPTSASTADVFVGGTPEISPPISSANNPGVFGGGGSPDIFLAGLAQGAGLTVNGGDATANQLIVNATTENSGGLAFTSGWAGSGMTVGNSPLVLQASTIRPTGDAFDTINVTDSAVTISNNVVGPLVTVNISGGFANPSPTAAAVIVNAGDEAGVQANGTADDVTVTLSPTIHFLVNGGLPPMPASPPLVGDELHVLTPGAIDIYSDTASPPHVSITTPGLQPVTYTSIEKLLLTPGVNSQTVNILGDNNGANPGQNDNIAVIGGDTDNIPATGGVNKFWVMINGSAPIGVDGTKFLNIDGEQGNNTITVKPYADNTHSGWGVQTNVANTGAILTGVGADINTLNYGNIVPFLIDPTPNGGIAGVTENVTVAPTTVAGAGQINVPNVATIDFTGTTDTNFFLNDGSSGDTDTLTLAAPAGGTVAAPTSVAVNLRATGTPASPGADVKQGSTQLVNIDQVLRETAGASMTPPTPSALAAVTVATGLGTSTVSVVGRSGATSLSPAVVNVVGDPSPATTSVSVLGTSGGGNAFTFTPGTDNASGTLVLLPGGTLLTTTLNLANVQALALDGGGTGNNTLSLNGTGGNDSFVLTGTGTGAGTASVDAGPMISFANFGATNNTINLNGSAGGNDSFNVTDFPNWGIASVQITGNAPATTDSVSIAGTDQSDAIAYTPMTANSGVLSVTSPSVGGTTTAFKLFSVSSASLDGVADTTGGDSLTVATAGTFTNTPGSQSGSGTVQVQLASGVNTLPLSYQHISSVAFTGTSLVVSAASANSTVVVDSSGNVSVNGNPVSTSGFTALVLNLTGGNNNVTIDSSTAFPGGISINGSTGPTNVTVVGTTGNDTIGVNAAAGTVTGITAGTITLSQVTNLTVNGNGGSDAFSVTGLGVAGAVQSIAVNGDNSAGDSLLIGGTGAPDNLAITPTGAGSGTAQDNGAGPVVSFTGISGANSLNVARATELTIDGTGAAPAATLTKGTVADPTLGVIPFIATIAGDVPVNISPTGVLGIAIQLATSGTLTVNSANGPITTPVSFDGGGSGALDLTGGSATSDAYAPGPNPGQGSDTLVFAGGTQTVGFTGLAPVYDNVAGPVTVVGTSGNDAISYTEGNDPTATPNAAWGQVSVNNQEALNFTNKTSLTINTGLGTDSVNINNPNVPTGLAGNITVNGGSPTAGDTLTVSGRVNFADSFTYTPATTTSDTGSVAIGGATSLPTVSFSGMEHLAINGQNGGPGGTGDTLTINTSNLSSNQTEILTPGSTFDSGHVDFRDRPGGVNPIAVPVDFSGLGVAGSVTFMDVGRFDNLIYNGTPLNDTFTVNAAGQVVLNTQIPVNTPSIETLTLAGLGGNDTFNIAGNHNLPGVGGGPGIVVEGSDPASNALNFTGNGAAAVTVDIGAKTVREAGFAPVSFTGVAVVNVNADGAPLNVIDGAANTNLAVTPTGAQAGTVQANGVGPVVNFTNANASGLVVGLSGGGSTLSIDGATAGQTFTATNTSVTVTGDIAVNYTAAQLAGLDVNGMGGGNQLIVNSSANAVTTPIIYNGGAGTGNSLELTGGTATSDTYAPGPNGGQGTDTLVFGSGTETVQFSNLTPVADNVTGPLTVNGTTGNDAITAGAGANTVTVNNLESITFSNKSSLTLNGNGGNDTFNISPANITLTGAGAITINGAAGADDSLTVNGTKTTGYTPSGSGGGSITTAGNPTVTFTNVASAAVVGDGAGDTLTLTNAGTLFTQFTAGATADSGSLTMQFGYSGPSATPLSFSNLGFSGGLTIPGAGFGSLDINGPTLASAFTVSSAGVVQIFKPLGAAPVTVPITTTDAAVRLIGHSGNDTFNVPGNQPFAFGLEVQGDAGNNTLNFTGDGTAPVTVDLGAGTVTEAGFGTVTYLGVGAVNVNANGQPLTVIDSAANNTLDVTPTGTDTSTVQIAGQSLVVNTTSGGNLNVTLGTNDALVVDGSQYNNTMNVSGTQVTDQETSGPATTLQTVAFTGAASLSVAGGGGSDTFNVTPSLSLPIFVDGGNPVGVLPGDTLNIVSGGSPVQFFAGPTSDSGGFLVGGNQPVSFVHIETIGPISGGPGPGPGPVLIQGTNGDDDIQVTATGPQSFTVSVNAGPAIQFVNEPTLYIDTLAGDDQTNITGPAAGSTYKWDETIDLAGVSHAAGSNNIDSLTVETPLQGGLTYTPSAANAENGTLVYNQGGTDNTTINIGAFTIPNFPAPPTTYTSSPGGVEQLVVNGEAAGDALSVVTPAGSNTVVYTPGATTDAATIAVGSLLPLGFTNLGSAASVSLSNTGGSRVDSLIYNGTAANDTFNVSAAGVVTLNSQLAVSTPGVANLTLNGLAGDNNYTLNATTPFTAINVNGSGASDPDVLNLVGDDVSPVTVSIGGPTSAVVGGGLGTVDISGVGVVNLSDLGAAVTVNGTSNPDTFDVTPTGTSSATVQANGVVPQVNLTATSLTVSDTNSHSVVVNGTSGSDTIGVVRGAVTSTVTVNALLPVNVTTANTTALTVATGLGTDTINVSGAGGPALTVLGGQTPASDILNVTNTATAGNTTYIPGRTNDSGTLANADGTISFGGIQSVFDTAGSATDTLLVFGTSGNDTITAAHVGSFNVAWINAQAPIVFSGFGTLTLNGRVGNDSFVVSPIGLTGLTAINVIGNAGANNTLTVNGNADPNAINYTPTSPAGSGTVAITGSATVSMTNMASLAINGQGGGDTLTVTTPAQANTVTLNPGTAVDSGSLSITSATNPTSGVPLSYSNLGAGGALEFANASGGALDTLVYNGTSGADTFNVAATTDVITLNGQLPVGNAAASPGIANLVLNGLAGNDTFNVTGPQPYTGISLNGGSAGTDIANVTGGGTAAAVSFNAGNETVTGGGLGTVTLAGIGTINVNSGAGGLTANDAVANNTFDVSLTGTNSTSLQIAGQAPVVNATSTGALSVGFTAANPNDALVVNGTQYNDSFTINGTSVAAVETTGPARTLQTVNFTNAASLTVNGANGNDTFNVTPGAVPINVNGSNPIGVQPGDMLGLTVGSQSVTYFPGPTADSGGFLVGGNAPVSFTQIESFSAITGTGGAGQGPVLIQGTNGDDDIQVTATGTQSFNVSVNGGPTIPFVNEPNLYIDSLAGDDEINITGPTTDMLWNENVFIAGASHAANSGNVNTVSFETPSLGSLTYTPTVGTPDDGALAFNQGGSNTSTITIGPFTVGSYHSSPGGASALTVNGGAQNETLTVVGTGGNDTFTHNPGSANDAGTVLVDSLLPINYTNLGSAGALALSDTGSGNTLIVNGAGNNDTFSVAATTGNINLDNRVPIEPTGMQNLVLNGNNPNDTFNLFAPLPYSAITVNGDPAVLNLNSATATTMAVDLAGQNITGFGGTVHYNGIATVNLNGNPSVTNTLNVTGTPNDDNIVYTPTSTTGGTFSLAGVATTYNFTIGSAAADVFTVFGGGATGADQVTVNGPNGGGVFTVNEPTRTITVDNSIGTALEPVVLDASVAVANVTGGLGNNTFLVVPARDTNLPAGTTDIVGGSGALTFQMPNNLLVNVNGGALSSEAALVVAGPGGATLGSDMFAAVMRGNTPNTGVIRMFQDSGSTEPIQYPDITYTAVSTLQTDTFDPAGDTTGAKQQTLVMGPDAYDPNGSLTTAAYLGSGAAINVSNVAIFPNSEEHQFVQPENDWFRVVAQYTGTMDFQVYFKQQLFATGDDALPGAGELNIDVYDRNGNLIGDFGANDTDSDQRRRIPVVAGETYYLKVWGADPSGLGLNGYNMSITNTPAPTPDSVGLNNVVANGSVNNSIVPTTTTFAANNAATPVSPPPPAFQTQPLPPLSSLDNFYVGMYLEFTSGTLIGQRELVSGYVAATHTFTFATAFGAAPAAGDTFQIESNDTGQSQFDNLTRDNKPTIYIRLDAANTPSDGLLDLQGGGSTSQTPPNNTPILIPFWAGNAATAPNAPANNGSFRIAVYDDSNPNSPVFLGYANAVAGEQGVFQLQVATAMTDGSHTLVAKVEIDSPTTPSDIDVGAGQSFQIVIDTQAPPVYFGSPTTPNSGLDGTSDTGIAGQPATIDDRITSDAAPGFFGVSEAGAVIRLYADPTNTGTLGPNDVFLGQTVATPITGTNQDLNGQWSLTSSVNLNNPSFGFPLDGLRTILVTAEDAAGNVSAPQELQIFLDTQGPKVGNVSVTGNPGYNLFANKPNQPTPTPLVNALDVTFTDDPNRLNAGPNADFVYPAVNPILATTVANYHLVGRYTGPVAITSVTYVDSTTSGTPGMGVATLHFAAPLPDDIYTLTISDHIEDNAGNALDGEFNGSTFPSGNNNPGGTFSGTFVVNSHPHLAAYSTGSVILDINGNGVFDPSNSLIDSDFAFAFGFPSDRLFAGNFANASGFVSGFDEVNAYGFLNGQWRWLYNLNPAAGTSQTTSLVQPISIDGLPVAGNFDGNPADGDQVGIFDGTTWYLDVLNHHVIDQADINAGGKLTGDMRGLPIVGDFDGTGKTSLATYYNGVFYFDLASRDPGGKLTGNYNATINVESLMPDNIGFADTLIRPVAADMDQDGITDIGLFVPGQTASSAGESSWYWLVSNDSADAHGVNPTGAFNSLDHAFNPTPLGHDLFYQFGNNFALPLVGIWDPPSSNSGGGSVSTDTANADWIARLYVTELDRQPNSGELSYWTGQINNGMSYQAVAQAIVDSAEHRGIVINQLYEQYLGRAADQGGLDYWIGVWAATGGPEAEQAGIIGSPEYYQTAGKLHPSLSPDAAWVTALYNNILGRDPDATGLAYWVNYIQTHSKQSVVMGFVTSDEYRLNLINTWYQSELGRTIDSGAAQYWVAQMRQGMTQDEIQIAILSSAEYRNKVTP